MSDNQERMRAWDSVLLWRSESIARLRAIEALTTAAPGGERNAVAADFQVSRVREEGDVITWSGLGDGRPDGRPLLQRPSSLVPLVYVRGLPSPVRIAQPWRDEIAKVVAWSCYGFRLQKNQFRMHSSGAERRHATR